MTAEERLARELFRQWMQAAFGNDGNWKAVGVSVERAWLALARHVLRRERAAVRRARGRTIGWVILRPECDESGEDCYWEIKGGLLDEPVNVRMTRLMGNEVARVVAVPKPRKGGRK